MTHALHLRAAQACAIPLAVLGGQPGGSARPGSRVVGMDTGHWPMLEKSAEFNEAVLSWLATGSASWH